MLLLNCHRLLQKCLIFVYLIKDITVQCCYNCSLLVFVPNRCLFLCFHGHNVCPMLIANTSKEFPAGLEDQITISYPMNSSMLTANAAMMNMLPLNGFASSLSQPFQRVTNAMAPTVQTLNSTNNQLNLQSTTSWANGLNNANTPIGSKPNLVPSLSGESDTKTKERCQYLQQLINDRKESQKYPTIFHHVERLLDEEIVRVRSVLFQSSDTTPLELPPPQGPVTALTEKVYVPVKEYPEYNFVGRILGPRGLTAKQLEQDAKCKIMVRGKGSMRDKKKEEANRGKPNWEHLNEDLHVLITVEDTENRARIKIKKAVEEVKRLLIPAEGEDDLKKKQLMELAIINGTYRDFSNHSGAPQPRLIAAPPMISLPGMRSPPPGQPPASMLSAPIITRLPNGQTVISNGAAPPPSLISPPDGAFYYTTPLEYPYTGLVATPGSSLLEYSFHDQALLGATPGAKIVRPRTDTRVHPYQRSPAATN